MVGCYFEAINMIWTQIIVAIVIALISVALAPGPPDARPSGIDDVDASSAEPGADIPVIFGEMEVGNFNTVTYGNLSVIPIRG